MVHDPKIKKIELGNGIRIIAHRMPHVRSVSMGVWANVGARDEAASENGLAHMIEHMIFKGTASRTAFEIARQFDAIGGQTNAFTSMETTCFHARVLDQHSDVMVDMLSDIFLNSLFDAEEVEKERPVILQEIGMVEDSPEEFVHMVLGETFWADHPLGRSILGSRDSVQGFDAEAIRNFFHQRYRPERILIAAAGNLDPERFVEQVAPAFRNISTTGDFPDRLRARSQSCVRVVPKDLEQVHICVAGPGVSFTDPQRYAFMLLSTLLGGNMSSRLFQEIRERRGLAYSVYSFAHSFEDAGMLGAYAAVGPGDVREALEVILAETEKLKLKPVEPAELADAKEYLKAGMILASESSDNEMVRLAQNEIHFQRHVYLEEVLENLDAVTADDLRKLAQDVFRPGQTALTLLGPVPEGFEFETLLN
ncbi:MAG: pitrilysin family protein [Desulfobacterales bacterium]|jgi:predicted Zn-dependent peptidase|nr:pitrilysin family protein [Desulfobacterales bacterium]MDD3082255.1 pitrilysin family protein [Desulfobacterales bacterium]MDD3950002.1 pitrilysin family protein [Desulfobacterales bacterium]MDY0376906.1 pitrilysin family protein [Desulfobacterales bacterium]